MHSYVSRVPYSTALFLCVVQSLPLDVVVIVCVYMHLWQSVNSVLILHSFAFPSVYRDVDKMFQLI